MKSGMTRTCQIWSELALFVTAVFRTKLEAMLHFQILFCSLLEAFSEQDTDKDKPEQKDVNTVPCPQPTSPGEAKCEGEVDRTQGTSSSQQSVQAQVHFPR